MDGQPPESNHRLELAADSDLIYNPENIKVDSVTNGMDPDRPIPVGWWIILAILLGAGLWALLAWLVL